MNLSYWKCLAGLTLVLALIAAAPVLVTTSSQTALARQKDDRALLDGKWTAVSFIERERSFDRDEAILLISFHIQGEKVTVSFFDKKQTGTIKIDPSKDPGQFELRFEGDTRIALGIYKLEKDLLTLCFTGSKKGRPVTFEAGKGSGSILIVLQRGEIKLSPEQEKKAREKIEQRIQRETSRNNLRQIGIAFQVYSDIYKKGLPTAVHYSADGKPLLSWRVLILPYLEEEELFKQFRLNEPWDSEHNRKLLPRMPKVYQPVRGKPKEPHSTYYQVFTGPGTIFEGPKGLLFSQITDGTSNTILVVEAGDAVPWTKPADLPYDPKRDLPPLGGLFEDGFHILMADGMPRWLRRTFDVPTFRLAITRNDGQVLDWGKLER
jgi:uncharacterized protein (TIGR03067 family)